MINAVSVDLEDWYHICGLKNGQWVKEWNQYSAHLEKSVDKILALLDKYEVLATFFVVGYVAEKNPRLIQKIANMGHEIASHGYFHRRISDMTPEVFEEDLRRSKSVIEGIIGKKVRGYRAPEWSLKEETRWALDILKKNGFEYDASANPMSYLSGKGFGLIPCEIKTKCGKIHEFPLSTVRMFAERIPFSGGLPLRVVPYCNVFSFFKSFNKKRVPVMLYLHSWEFDIHHPKVDLPLNRKFMHYFNCKVTPIKVEKLFQYFNFTTIENVLVPEMSRETNRVFTKKPAIHKEYVISSSLTFIGFLLAYSLLFALPKFMGLYSLFALLIGMTILYWPWTTISNCVESIKKRIKK